MWWENFWSLRATHPQLCPQIPAPTPPPGFLTEIPLPPFCGHELPAPKTIPMDCESFVVTALRGGLTEKREEAWVSSWKTCLVQATDNLPGDHRGQDVWGCHTLPYSILSLMHFISRRLRLREVKKLSQWHTAPERQGCI